MQATPSEGGHVQLLDQQVDHLVVRRRRRRVGPGRARLRGRTGEIEGQVLVKQRGSMPDGVRRYVLVHRAHDGARREFDRGGAGAVSSAISGSGAGAGPQPATKPAPAPAAPTPNSRIASRRLRPERRSSCMAMHFLQIRMRIGAAGGSVAAAGYAWNCIIHASIRPRKRANPGIQNSVQNPKIRTAALAWPCPNVVEFAGLLRVGKLVSCLHAIFRRSRAQGCATASSTGRRPT